jgi:cell division protein FtsI (penicillin-binding protein 3)
MGWKAQEALMLAQSGRRAAEADATQRAVRVEDELRKPADFDMKGGVGLCDTHSGAVRAVASWPAIDPNRRGDFSADMRSNRALNSRFELGSIYKPLTVAAAMDAGVLTPQDRFDVSAPVKIGAALVKDPHPLPNAKSVTAGDIQAFSSNIGASLIAQRMGVERQKDFLRRFTCWRAEPCRAADGFAADAGSLGCDAMATVSMATVFR